MGDSACALHPCGSVLLARIHLDERHPPDDVTRSQHHLAAGALSDAHSDVNARDELEGARLAVHVQRTELKGVLVEGALFLKRITAWRGSRPRPVKQ